MSPQGTPSSFLFFRAPDGRFTRVSAEVEGMTGRPAGAWVGQEDWYADPRAGNQAALESLRAHLAGRFDDCEVILEVARPDGSTITLEILERAVVEEGRLLELVGIARDVTSGRRARVIQAATYRIAEAAFLSESQHELFETVHQIVGELMPAENFYVALDDPATHRIHFPYFVDTRDPPPEPRAARRGLTEYVLRTGEPLLATPEVFEELVRRGEVEEIGGESVDWLGVPLRSKGRPIGVLAVQSYTEGVRYGAQEKQILLFVSTQVAMATERARAEEARRESEQRIRDIIEHSTNLFYTHTPDQILTYVSPQSRQFFDCEPEEALVRWTEFATTNPINLKGIDATERAIRTGQRQPVYELELVGRKGRRLWVEVNEAPVVRDGRTVGVVGALSDITAKKKAEERLRLLSRIAEQVGEGVAAADLDGRLIFVNQAWAEMHGYEPGELIGNPLGIFHTPEQMERDVLPFNAAVLRHGRHCGEVGHARRDGTVFPTEMTTTLLTDDAAQPYGFVGFARDISDRRRHEEVLRHAQKMEAVGQLAGGVAHDFNNILQAMMSAARVLGAAASGGDGRVARTLMEMEAYIKRGAALTRQLLLFARRDVVQPERLDLNEVLRETATLLRRLVRENIRFRRLLSPLPLPVDADRGQLEQVLVNLVLNAADAMPDGGEVVLRTGRNGHDEAWCEVQDQGPGIPEEVRGRIFEPFFTTKPKGQGTGLGLAVVHGIISEMHGRVEVVSQPGRGCTFRVVLPLREVESVSAPVEATVATEHPRGSGERVLVVEDEEGVRVGLCDLLESLGYSVSAVTSGEEAVALQSPEAFDLLVTDYMLPGLHGWDLMVALQARWPSLRTIIMSGYAGDEAMRQGVREGSIRYLQKPFDAATLAREVCEALADPPRRSTEDPPGTD